MSRGTYKGNDSPLTGWFNGFSTGWPWKLELCVTPPVHSVDPVTIQLIGPTYFGETKVTQTLFMVPMLVEVTP